MVGEIETVQNEIWEDSIEEVFALKQAGIPTSTHYYQIRVSEGLLRKPLGNFFHSPDLGIE